MHLHSMPQLLVVEHGQVVFDWTAKPTGSSGKHSLSVSIACLSF